MVRGDGREGREMRNGKEVQERFGCRDWRDLWEGWCYNMSGSFRTTTITLTLLAPRRGLDSSSGTAQRMISRARRQYADDYATMWRQGGVLCCGTMLWRQHPLSDTAWLRYARTRVLWHDVAHHATRRDRTIRSVSLQDTAIPRAVYLLFI